MFADNEGVHQVRLKALLVGNSDGIGLATTRRLIATGWEAVGVSRSETPFADAAYRHRVADVCDSNYPEVIADVVSQNPFDLCIYFVGIGELLDPLDMSQEAQIVDANLTGMGKTAAANGWQRTGTLHRSVEFGG